MKSVFLYLRFCIPVNERSPEEQKRLKIMEEERLAKEQAKRAQKGLQHFSCLKKNYK